MHISRAPLVAAGAVVAVVALGLALYLFQPWTLFVDERVSEALPVAASSPSAVPSQPPPPAPSEVTAPAVPDPAAPLGASASASATQPASEPLPSQTGPVELARGELISHEHTSTGTARVLALDDGSRVLRLEGLSTSNGPDLHVWLTDAPVIDGRDGWFVFDDGDHVDLGELRGNQGDANYPIPAEVDLGRLTSVSIWCERFRVSFGAAELG